MPHNDLATLSYDLALGEVGKVLFSPTRLESTSLMLVYGKSLFFNKVMPDNSFDRLGDDFNYVFLVLSVVVVVLATHIAKSFVNRTRINQHFA